MAASQVLAHHVPQAVYDKIRSTCESAQSGAGNVFVEKLGVRVVTMPSQSGPTMVVGFGEIKAPLEEVFACCNDLDKRGKWDTFFDTGRIVKEDAETKERLIHFSTKSNFTVWPRDFVVIAGSKNEADGSIFLAATSVAEPSVADIKGFVRGTVHVAGFHLSPAPDVPGTTRSTRICYLDVAGWIPAAIANLVNKYQPLGIIGIRKLLTGSSSP